jgi:hypothetical protein
MPARKSLVSTLWLASSLALLASVLVAPVRTSGFIAVSSRPDCLRLDFAIPPVQPTTLLSTTKATNTVLELVALPFEIEEQHRSGALGEPRISFLIPCSFLRVPDRQAIAPRSILSLYPLRC